MDLVDPRHKNKENAEAFICLICQNLVWGPKRCRKCSKIFCKECIEEVKYNGDKKNVLIVERNIYQ